MGKPISGGNTIYPNWSTAKPWSSAAPGDTTVQVPDPSLVISGWPAGFFPPNQWFNYEQSLYGVWLTYADLKMMNTEPLVLRSATSASWNGSTGVLTFGSAIQIIYRNISGSPWLTQIASGSFTLADGEVIVVNRDRATNNVTLASHAYPPAAGQYSQTAESNLTAVGEQGEMILFRRNGSTLEIPFFGEIYQSGSIIFLGGSSGQIVQNFSAQTSVTVTHNLNRPHVVAVYGSSNGFGAQIYPDTVTTGATSDTITFGGSQSGSIVIQ